jgi:hypothetical protein
LYAHVHHLYLYAYIYLPTSVLCTVFLVEAQQHLRLFQLEHTFSQQSQV